jgi:hypothetical protein
VDQAIQNRLEVSSGGRRFGRHAEMGRMRQSLSSRAFLRKESGRCKVAIKSDSMSRHIAVTRWLSEHTYQRMAGFESLLGQALPDACRDRGPCFGRSASLSHVSSRRHLTHLNTP